MCGIEIIKIDRGLIFEEEILIGTSAYIQKRSRKDYNRWRKLQQGPNIVVVGGGTGLSVLLRGLKEYTSNITAIVSVGDDGGSSGRIREEFGMVPVGDVRNCIVALSDREELMEQIFDYRFQQGEGLDGHSLGNLLLVAMTHLTGSFHDAVSDINEVLQIRGRVLPVTDVPITLKAILDDDREIVGESCVSQADRPIMRLTIEPENVEPLAEALEAIREADAIVLGPGSLFTSIIPNLLVDGIVDAILQSKAMKFYVCNVMT
ncbi:MAG: YvcK family protein, partial [Peptococcaceae bacterium]|nr:YvcK family protein [Peptococcaceae bacterium]